MRISDWSSDVCSSGLVAVARDRAYPHLAHRLAAHGIDGVTQQIEDDLLDLDLVDQDGAEPRFDLQIAHLGNPGRPHAGEILRLDEQRSDERRVGKECVSTLRSGCLWYH